MMCSKFSSGSKTPRLFSIATCISNDLVILDHRFHAWALSSIAKNPQEQSVMQGHTMTWRPRLERNTAIIAHVQWHLSISPQAQTL